MFVNPFANPFAPAFGGMTFSVQPAQTSRPNEKRYINYNAGSGDGCMMYRRGFVSHHIRYSGLGDVTDLTKMVYEKGFYDNITSISLQRQAAPHQKEFLQYLKSLQPEFGFKLIYESDDVVFREEIPDYNASKFGFDSEEVRQNCSDMIRMVDEVTVTNKFLRDMYIEKTGQTKITAVPNFMPYWWSGHQYNYNRIVKDFDNNKKKPRIVYAGSGAHFDVKNLNGQRDDFTHVIKFIVDNRHKYQFVFVGAYPPPLKPFVDSKEIEVHPWQTLVDYPNFLAAIRAQLFIAPLQDNNFNKAKSDIKFIEAAQLGIPCLCQDMVTYSSCPESMRFKTVDELGDKIERMLNWKNRSKYYQLVPELRKIGETRFLEHPQNFGCFLEAFNTPYDSKERIFLKRWN